MAENQKETIGCIVGRFQTHELHEGHREIINYVVANHKKVVLFLGISPVLGTTNNPLDFSTRQKMIKDAYPDIQICAIPDNRYDEVWSKNLDSRIREIFPMGSVKLYGSRDSFIPSYKGSFLTEEFKQNFYISGTEIRKMVSDEVKANPDWRAGVIYGAYNRYATSYQTVDIACFRDDEILLAQKPGEIGYRFPGGFVDPTDESLERAARREWFEETGGNAEIGDLKYVASLRIDDWRYKSGRDKIMSALFYCKFGHGRVEPSDDVSALKWISFSEFTKSGGLILIVPEHAPLMMALIEYYNKIKK